MIGLGCAAICWVLNQWKVVRNLENWALDDCYVLRGERTNSGDANLRIIAIDDNTLAALDKPLMYLSPELAQVIDYVCLQGARVVGVDFMVPETVESFDGLRRGKPGDVGKMGKSTTTFLLISAGSSSTWIFLALRA